MNFKIMFSRRSLKDIIIAILLLVSAALWIYTEILDKEKEKTKRELREGILRSDKLLKISDGYYTKLLADSLTKKELRKKIKELGLDLENALLAQEIIIQPRDTVTVIDSIIIGDSTITFTDYYPKKENFFVEHTTIVNNRDTSAVGKFVFNPVSIKLGIGQKEDGTYEVKTKVPEFFNVTSLDVQSLPMETPKKDNFGILVGLDHVNRLNDKTSEIDINSYLRFGKFYIGGGYRTDNTTKVGIKFEF